MRALTPRIPLFISLRTPLLRLPVTGFNAGPGRQRQRQLILLVTRASSASA
jgi:hypothetical protein